MRVVIWVLLIIFVLLVLANMFGGNSSNKESTFTTESRLRALYCEYRGREGQVMRELTFEMGGNPKESLQPGDVVVLYMRLLRQVRICLFSVRVRRVMVLFGVDVSRASIPAFPS